MAEHAFITPKEQKGYVEETIIPYGTQELYTFSLSNSLDDIEVAIYERTGRNINLDNASWKINQNLSINIKHLMNKHHVIYSMTTGMGKRKCIWINMHVGDKWFISGYEEFDGKYINFGLLETFRYLKKLLDTMDDDE